jgi:catalase
MVANLRNVDDDLATGIADGLGLDALPKASPAAAEPDLTLAPSPLLSILANPPASFAGRKLGILVTDGAPAATIKALRAAMKAEQANVEIIAPAIAGVTLDDGTLLPADQMVGGGPSVLYDAIAIIASADGAADLALLPAAKDFVTDAHAHCKHVGHTPDALAVFAAAGTADAMDDGYHELSSRTTTKHFGEACRSLRHWDRAT